MDGSVQLFEPGEKVMYPQFGLGTIAGVTKKQVGGTDLSFYRLEFPLKQMEILVPVRRASENGLRRVMSSREVAKVLEYVSCAPPSAKPQQWHRWRKKTLEQLKSGDPLEIAKIFCYLQSLEGKKGLSFTERKILLQVERMLISEIAAAKQISETDAEKVIANCKKAASRARANARANGSAGRRTNGRVNGSANGRANGSANGSAAAKANGHARRTHAALTRTNGTKRTTTSTRRNGTARANGKVAHG